MSKSKMKFCKIPKFYLSPEAKNNPEVMIYRSLSYCENLRGESRVSIAEITQMCNYSLDLHEYGFCSIVKSYLLKFLQDKKIIQIAGTPCSKATINSHLTFRLLENFYSSKFIVLTDEEFDSIIRIRSCVPRYTLLRCYLYLKSFMFQNTEQLNGMVCAFYRDMDDTAEVLNITRKQLDRALQLFIKNSLLIKHETGSYKNSIGLITNAPNIYVLTSDDQSEEHINDAIKRLKHILKVEKFMPTVYRGKRMKTNEHMEFDEDLISLINI